MNGATSFDFVRAHPGGLLLDLASGSLFRLNESAALIWEAWLGGATAAEIARRLERAYDLSPKTAEEHATAALNIDPAEGTTIAPSGDFLYERREDGYLLSRAGAPFLMVDEKGEHLHLHDASRVSATEIEAALTAVAPKLIALRGHFVLHAAAVILDGVAFVVSGDSGAGKTTTARALVRAGASPLAEDKLIVRETGTRPTAFPDFEARVQRWARQTHADLSRGMIVPCPEVADLCEGPAVPIGEIGFIAAAGRDGDVIAALEMTALDASGALFRNSFCGSDVASDWGKNLRAATAIAEGVQSYDLTMPAGVSELGEAARAVIARRSFRSK
jgi:hypothetical protein